MKPKSFERLSIFELARMYEDAATLEGDATEKSDYKTANKSFDLTQLLRRELLRRGPEGRAVILGLMGNDSPWVRLSAAIATLAFAAEQAEPVLRELASRMGACGLTAEMTLSEWEKGTLSFDG